MAKAFNPRLGRRFLPSKL